MEVAFASPMTTFKSITVDANVYAPVEAVWKHWTEPASIMQWNHASDDWQCPSSVNDLRDGGTFSARMEAKDGSMGFDFGGTYTKVIPKELIEYVMSDGRKVSVVFQAKGDQTYVTETFDAETENSEEMQRGGWQAILNNFKAYTEANK